MKKTSVAFIGGGNMARSLIGGLITDGWPPQQIWVSDPDVGQLNELIGRFGVNTTTDNNEAAAAASIVVLAVKPQKLQDVGRQLAGTIQRSNVLIISVAAGVREPDLRTWFGGDVALVRTMPNTPALVGSGATALFANSRVSSTQQQLAESILRAVGITIWVTDEALLDAVTALSGSGPAYFFSVMEAMEEAGVNMGLSPNHARLLTLQTALGAAKMALESSEGPDALRARVTSPGGTTERALAVLQQGNLEGLFNDALEAARQRSRELGEILGQKNHD